MARIDGDGRAAARATQAGKRTRQMNRSDGAGRATALAPAQATMKVVLALAMGAAALAPNQPQVAGKVAAKAAGAAALGAAMTLSGAAFAAPATPSGARSPSRARRPPTSRRTTCSSTRTRTCRGRTSRRPPAKFAPKTNWNTLYPESG